MCICIRIVENLVWGSFPWVHSCPAWHFRVPTAEIYYFRQKTNSLPDSENKGSSLLHNAMKTLVPIDGNSFNPLTRGIGQNCRAKFVGL